MDKYDRVETFIGVGLYSFMYVLIAAVLFCSLGLIKAGSHAWYVVAVMYGAFLLGMTVFAINWIFQRATAGYRRRRPAFYWMDREILRSGADVAHYCTLNGYPVTMPLNSGAAALMWGSPDAVMEVSRALSNTLELCERTIDFEGYASVLRVMGEWRAL